MENIFERIRRIEFEARIFVSFSIVIFVCVISFNDSSISLLEKSGNLFGLNNHSSLIIGYSFLAVFFLFISLFRMWSGGLLTPVRVMRFKVQTDALIKNGPYSLVRNPIYLCDWLAICGISLCFPWKGILLPILFYIHYIQIIKYEEKSLLENYGKEFVEYTKSTPRLIPNPKSFVRFLKDKLQFGIDKNGFRYNALFVLFIPGFVIAAINQNFLYAAIIGIPGVIDWAVIHTKIGLNKTPAEKRKKRAEKKKRVFKSVLYSNCWEDPQIDREAFAINEEDVVFSITSGGCNVLTFLLDNPKKVISLDLNPCQNFLLELKINAFRILAYDEILELLGIRKSQRRIALYKSIRPYLSINGRNFWNDNMAKVKKGIIHSGRYESYMRLLRSLLIMFVGRDTINEFYKYEDPGRRKEIFEKKWNNLRWKIFTRVFLSRAFMSLLFDKDFFKYLEENFSFGKHFALKTKYALTVLPVKENYFLSYILLGNYYNEDHLPYYLRPDNYGIIKSRLDRIDIVTDNCYNYFARLPEESIDKFNFTNIFEWISECDFEKLLNETIRVAKDGAVMTYRNLLVFREHSLKLNSKIKANKELADKLLLKDYSFIYDKYVIEQIVKESEKWHIKLQEYSIQEH